MMLGTKTALGIDVSDNKINLALLKQGRNGIKLVKAVSGPLPADAVNDGNIKNPDVLARAIRLLKSRSRIPATQTAISLFAKPAVVQIMDIPKPIPESIRQFVQDELKQCVPLSGGRIGFDFCGIGSAGRESNTRLLVAAANGQNLVETVRAYNKAGLNVKAIEPPQIACARALYSKKIAKKFDCSVLIVMLRCGSLTSCVFKNQTIDFVRTKRIDNEETEPTQVCQQLEKEIKAIIQSCDVEAAHDSKKWEIAVVADDIQLPADSLKVLKANVTCGNLQVVTSENAWQDEPFNLGSGFDRPSVVAIGLAMGLLDANGYGLRINLFPSEVFELESVKRDLLLAANVLAMVTLAMVLVVGGLVLMVKRMNQNIIQKKPAQLLQETYTMLREQELINKQIERMSNRPNLLSIDHDIDWSGLLEDIRKATPSTVRITSLSSQRGSKISLKGQALSYEGVRLFVNMLNKSQHIKSASPVEMKISGGSDRLVEYVIEFAATVKKEG